MRPITFSFPTITQNEICATQFTTATDQSLLINGSLAVVNAKGQYPYALAPGIQRPVAIFSTGNIETSTFTITGYDCRATGLLSTTLIGPTGTATQTQTTTEFNRVVSVTVGAVSLATFTVGFGASGSTNWVNPNKFQDPFNVTISVANVGTGAPITVQDTPLDLNVTAPTAAFTYNHTVLATITTATQSNYQMPVTYMRAIFTATRSTAANSTATVGPSVVFQQAGSGA